MRVFLLCSTFSLFSIFMSLHDFCTLLRYQFLLFLFFFSTTGLSTSLVESEMEWESGRLEWYLHRARQCPNLLSGTLSEVMAVQNLMSVASFKPMDVHT